MRNQVFTCGICLLGLVMLSLASPAGAEDQPASQAIDYENHSLLTVPLLPADMVDEFWIGGFDVVRQLPDGSMKVVATSRDRDRLISRFGAVVDIDNMEEYYRKGLVPDKLMGGYHTYDETVSELTALHTAHPSITYMEIIGYTLEGRAIYAFKISDNASTDETGEPEVMFNGLVHAREPMGLEICLTTINYLLDNQSDPQVAEMINNSEIWFVPIINADGYVYNEQTNPLGGGMWRKNRRDNGDGTFGIDLNRNWGFKWAAYPNSSWNGTSEVYHGTGPFSEPATQVMREFINAHSFVSIVNYHSFGNITMIPFGVANVAGCPDNPIFDNYINMYASMTGYQYGTIGGPTGFGGDAACWQYAEQMEKPKSFAYLVEVASEFWPSVEEMEDHCQRHLEANLYLLEDIHEMVKHPSSYLRTDFTNIDSVVNECSYDFTKEFTLWYDRDTLPVTISMSFANIINVPGWCTPALYNGTLNPGESVSISFDMSVTSMYGMPHGTTGYGQVQLVIYTQEATPQIDMLNFDVLMIYEADDYDGDGLVTCRDNCPRISNIDQTDIDTDGVGDSCDNCWTIPNSDQADADYDGAGDACDICPGENDFVNHDNDELVDCLDNCPTVDNAEQEDFDEDGVGDACDNCVETVNPDQADSDDDNVGDLCDVCPGFDDHADADGDTVPDSCDNCPETANADQVDTDENGVGDACQYECGDANNDHELNVGDAVAIVNYVFKGGPGPDPICIADANGDDDTNIADAVWMINYIFKGGPPPKICCP